MTERALRRLLADLRKLVAERAGMIASASLHRRAPQHRREGRGMTALAPKLGFDWLKVNWGAPDEERTDRCSYCGDAFPDDDDFVPLILWNKDGRTAEFCDHCQAAWFGLELFDAPIEDTEP
jgi:hypothetical protein